MLRDQPKYWLASDTLYVRCVYFGKFSSNNKTHTLYTLRVDNHKGKILIFVV